MHFGNRILAPLRLNAIFDNFTQIHDLLKRLDQYNYTFWVKILKSMFFDKVSNKNLSSGDLGDVILFVS